jgi:hypothetical protein
MARILIQSTLPDGEGEWHVGRFSSLVDLLCTAGHDVVARNRQPREDGNDPVLATLATSSFDQLWLFAADSGNGLAPADVRGVLRFRERGGGLFTSRDRENVGLSLLNLGTVGRVNHFRTYNRPSRRHRFRAALNRRNGEDTFERIIALEPVHEVLRTRQSPSGVIEYFPAATHDTAISVPPNTPFARVIAIAADAESDASANVAIAIDGERCHDGTVCGRAVATASLHHFANGRWNGHPEGPSEVFKDFARNIARWLAPASVLS